MRPRFNPGALVPPVIDSAAAALDTSVDTVARTRQQLVEEGFDAVLVRKHSQPRPDRASLTAPPKRS
jgi:hypothetical protein